MACHPPARPVHLKELTRKREERFCGPLKRIRTAAPASDKHPITRHFHGLGCLPWVGVYSKPGQRPARFSHEVAKSPAADSHQCMHWSGEFADENSDAMAYHEMWSYRPQAWVEVELKSCFRRAPQRNLSLATGCREKTLRIFLRPRSYLSCDMPDFRACRLSPIYLVRSVFLMHLGLRVTHFAYVMS